MEHHVRSYFLLLSFSPRLLNDCMPSLSLYLHSHHLIFTKEILQCSRPKDQGTSGEVLSEAIKAIQLAKVEELVVI